MDYFLIYVLQRKEAEIYAFIRITKKMLLRHKLFERYKTHFHLSVFVSVQRCYSLAFFTLIILYFIIKIEKYQVCQQLLYGMPFWLKNISSFLKIRLIGAIIKLQKILPVNHEI